MPFFAFFSTNGMRKKFKLFANDFPISLETLGIDTKNEVKCKINICEDFLELVNSRFRNIRQIAHSLNKPETTTFLVPSLDGPYPDTMIILEISS